MGDWIFNAVSEKNVSELTIDFWNNTIVPNELQIKPILKQLPRLKETVLKTLESQNFESDFIRTGILKSKKDTTGYRCLDCRAILTDKTGIKHIGKAYTEAVYEDEFSDFK